MHLPHKIKKGDINTISVFLNPSINLYTSCVQYIDITGFNGTKSAEPSLDVMSSSHAFVFQVAADWDQQNGTIRVRLSADMLAGTRYSFSFRVR